LNPNGENIMTTTTVKTNGLAEAASLLATANTPAFLSQLAVAEPKKLSEVLGWDKSKKKGSKKAGPKEQQLAAMRMPTEGSVPAFLDRTKGLTKEQIAASGDKARENAERGIAKGVARGLTSPAPRPSNLTDADKKVIAELSKADAAKKAEKKAADLARLTKLNADKKAERAGIKAVKDAVKAEQKADNKKAKKETTTAPKRAVGDRARYDWNGAREAAAKGTIPAAPDFSANTHRCYRGLLAEVVALVKAKDLAGLLAYRVKGSSTSPAAVKRYREIAIVALKAKKAAS
jgi:hypothetical protein